MVELPNTPKITPVTILAALTWVASQAVAYGWLKHGPDQQTLSGAATLLALGVTWADAHLRGKRAIAHAILNAPVPTVVADTKVPLVTPVVPPV